MNYRDLNKCSCLVISHACRFTMPGGIGDGEPHRGPAWRMRHVVT